MILSATVKQGQGQGQNHSRPGLSGIDTLYHNYSLISGWFVIQSSNKVQQKTK